MPRLPASRDPATRGSAVIGPDPPTRATPASWGALLARADVVEDCALGSTFGFMAFHGGLEAGTLPIARAAAEVVGASWYTVDQPAHLRWHVPSVLVDPARSVLLRRFLDHVEVVIALHGYGRKGRPLDVLIGGANRTLAGVFAGEVRHRCGDLVAVDDIEAIPSNLRGMHPANPVNRPAGAGIQVELPVRARLMPRSGRMVEALAATARRWG
ncbi:MAG: poly-gamma-glutamate hydrolase family protein [Actinomycetota bacterium]|nr:poly-gamma-glutamate hydrolase family protein [Actinomycetota bacterium]